jgi:hypothetical protein
MTMNVIPPMVPTMISTDDVLRVVLELGEVAKEENVDSGRDTVAADGGRVEDRDEADTEDGDEAGTEDGDEAVTEDGDEAVTEDGDEAGTEDEADDADGSLSGENEH